MASLILPFAIDLANPSTRLAEHPWRRITVCEGIAAYADEHGMIMLKHNSAVGYLLGHQFPVVSATILHQYQIEEHTSQAIATLDTSGAVAVWAVEDGRCLLYHHGAGKDGKYICIHTIDGLLLTAHGHGMILYDSTTLDVLFKIDLDCEIDSVTVKEDVIYCHGKEEVSVWQMVTDSADKIVSIRKVDENCVNNVEVDKIDTVVVNQKTASFYSTSWHAFNDHFVIGGNDGQFLYGHLDSLFSLAVQGKPIELWQTCTNSNISTVHLTNSAIWIGDEEGAVMVYDRDMIKMISCSRLSTLPISMFYDTKEFLLSLSRDNTMAVYCQSTMALLYTIKFDDFVQLMSIDDARVTLQSTSRQYRVCLESGTVDKVIEVGNETMMTMKSNNTDPVLLSLGQHGLVKILHSPNTLSKLIITVDIRAVLTHLPLCPFANDLLVLIGEGNFGVVGANGNLALSSGHNCSMTKSAVGLLSYMALDMTLNKATYTNINGLPRRLLHDLYPSVSVLSKFWCDYVRVLEKACRTIITLYWPAISTCTARIITHWQPHLITLSHNHVKPMNRAAIIIAIMMSMDSKLVMDPSTQQAVTASLLLEMKDTRKHLFRIAAITLLGDLITVIEPFIPGGVYTELVCPWTKELLESASDPWTVALLTTIRASIVKVLIGVPECVSLMAKDDSLDPGTILSLFHSLITSDNCTLHGTEVTMVECIVRLLDPVNPKQRSRLLPTAAPLLHALCSSHPHIHFNTHKQLLACAHPDGILSVYDLKTGLRCFHYTLPRLQAVCTSDSGDLLVGYADSMIVWCRVQVPVSVMAMLGVASPTGPCVNTIRAPSGIVTSIQVDEQLECTITFTDKRVYHLTLV